MSNNQSRLGRNPNKQPDRPISAQNGPRPARQSAQATRNKQFRTSVFATTKPQSQHGADSGSDSYIAKRHGSPQDVVDAEGTTIDQPPSKPTSGLSKEPYILLHQAIVKARRLGQKAEHMFVVDAIALLLQAASDDNLPDIPGITTLQNVETPSEPSTSSPTGRIRPLDNKNQPNLGTVEASPSLILPQSKTITTTLVTPAPSPSADDSMGSPVYEQALQHKSKRQKVSYPQSLRETMLIIQSQKDLVTGEGTLSLNTVASTVFAQVRERSVDPDLQNIPENDLAVVGNMLFAHVFGDSGREKVAKLLSQLHNPAQQMAAAKLVFNSANVARDLRSAGQDVLATFAAQLADVIKRDDLSNTPIGELQLAYTKVQLVQTWESWGDKMKDDTNSLSTFLTEHGFPPKHGVVLSSRVANYLGQQLGFKENKFLTSRVYRWRPLAMLVDAFGLGILPFIPRSLEKQYKQLSSTGGRRRDSHKENTFRYILTTLANSTPKLRQLCDATVESIVDPVIYGRSPERTKGVMLIEDGNHNEFQSLSVWDLVQPLKRGDGLIKDITTDSAEL